MFYGWLKKPKSLVASLTSLRKRNTAEIITTDGSDSQEITTTLRVREPQGNSHPECKRGLLKNMEGDTNQSARISFFENGYVHIPSSEKTTESVAKCYTQKHSSQRTSTPYLPESVENGDSSIDFEPNTQMNAFVDCIFDASDEVEKINGPGSGVFHNCNHVLLDSVSRRKLLTGMGRRKPWDKHHMIVVPPESVYKEERSLRPCIPPKPGIGIPEPSACPSSISSKPCINRDFRLRPTDTREEIPQANSYESLKPQQQGNQMPKGIRRQAYRINLYPAPYVHCNQQQKICPNTKACTSGHQLSKDKPAGAAKELVDDREKCKRIQPDQNPSDESGRSTRTSRTEFFSPYPQVIYAPRIYSPEKDIDVASPYLSPVTKTTTDSKGLRPSIEALSGDFATGLLVEPGQPIPTTSRALMDRW